MTTVAAEVKNIRRLLDDQPDSDVTAGSVASGSTTSVTMTSTTKHAAGTWWEFDDDTGDVIYETVFNPSTAVATIRRNYLGSTGTSHSSGAVVLKQPKFRYDIISQAINQVLDIDLYGEGIYDLQEHQITSSATTSYYNSPAADCLEFKDVYQFTSLMVGPARDNLWFSPKPRNVDTTLFAAGKYFVITGNYGTAGTALYYVTCAHKHTISTLTAGATRIVQCLAAAYLLEWTEPRRLQGPTTQGDQTVRPGASLPTAAYFRSLAEEYIQKERRTIKDLIPSHRRFVRNA